MKKAFKVLAILGVVTLTFFLTFYNLAQNPCWDFGKCESKLRQQCQIFCEHHEGCMDVVEMYSWCCPNGTDYCCLLFIVYCEDGTWARASCVSEDQRCKIFAK